jgi:hypothetical protein
MNYDLKIVTYCDMTPESRNSSLLGKHNPAEANASKNRIAVFSVVSNALVATQRCGKRICAAVNQRATIEEAVFSLGAYPWIYNEDIRQLELQLRLSPELAVGRIIEQKWQARN